MKLSKIEIKNFRSIANIEISPNPTCQVFVGINESGKTNILDAVSLLSPNIKLNKNDVRLEKFNEDKEQNSYVRYSFELTKEEIKTVVDDFLERIYSENPLPKISLPNNEISIEDLFLSKNTGLFHCNMKTEKKEARYYTFNKHETVDIVGLRKKKSTIVINSLESSSGEIIDLSKYDFIETSCIDASNINSFEKCTTNDLNICFGGFLCKFINNNLPNIIYWKYDNKYLLPNSIGINEICSDPTSCIPLQSMFNLAGYHPFVSAITDALNKKPHFLTNILHQVSKSSTEYLHNVWRDYKNVSFELRRNGNDIDILIQDSDNFFTCEQRSDGFKRFLTFLLMLSARVNNADIENSIIIIDEPDLGIHILGQRNLVQELIKISNNNLVFYSTHSIFMIDQKEYSRHFIVNKKDGITSITQASDSNYTDDEVLFNALGFTIFEVFKQRNIIFEGWTDKKAFEIAIASKKRKNIARLDQVGKIHATGVKTIVNIAKNLELAEREYIIISDSDQPAIETKKIYLEKEKCIGEWHMYSDHVSGIHTLEDFISHTVFRKSIEAIRNMHKDLGKFDYTSFKTKNVQKATFIKAWIKKFISDDKIVKIILKEIKEHLYSNLKSTDFEDTYYDLLDSLKQSDII